MKPALVRRLTPEQSVRPRRHDEIVMVQTVNLVGPPAHRYLAELQQQGRMVALLFSQVRHLVGKGLRLDKIAKTKLPLQLTDAIYLNDLPVREFHQQRILLFRGHAWGVSPAGFTALFTEPGHGTLHYK